MTTERHLRNLVLQAASKLGARLFRNNCGVAWAGKLVSRSPDGTVILSNARPVHFGLTDGSADLIGIFPVTITAAMVGQTFGRFISVELKTGLVPMADDQTAWLAFVQSAGGRAGVARSVEEAEAVIRSATSPVEIPMGRAIAKP